MLQNVCVWYIAGMTFLKVDEYEHCYIYKKNDFVLFKMQLKKDSIFTDPVQHYMCQELKIQANIDGGLQ